MATTGVATSGDGCKISFTTRKISYWFTLALLASVPLYFLKLVQCHLNSWRRSIYRCHYCQRSCFVKHCGRYFNEIEKINKRTSFAAKHECLGALKEEVHSVLLFSNTCMKEWHWWKTTNNAIYHSHITKSLSSESIELRCISSSHWKNAARSTTQPSTQRMRMCRKSEFLNIECAYCT